MYGYTPHGVDDLRDSADLGRKSVIVEDFVNYIYDLHKEVKENLENKVNKYKEYVDAHKRIHE